MNNLLCYPFYVVILSGVEGSHSKEKILRFHYVSLRMTAKKLLKYSISLLLIFSMFLLYGCGEAFLHKDTPLSVSTSDIFTDPARIESTVLGLYGTLKMDADRQALLGGKMLVAFDNRGEDMINVSNNIASLYAVYLMTTGDANDECITFWRLAYRAINNANTFLEKIESARSLVGDANYALYVAEARFVRAMAYYYLCMMYSKQPYMLNPNARAVPLRLQAEINGKNNNLAASTVSEVFAAILEEIKDETITALPVASATYNAVTRATKGAALMLRVRVKMAMGNWDGAIADATAITGYSLTPTVKAPFSSPYCTSENIFSLPMAANNVPNTQNSYEEYYYGTTNVMTVNMDAPGIISEAAYSQKGDARIANFVEWNSAKGFHFLAKYTATQKSDWIPVFRYAETLLNLAECYAAKGGSSETQAQALLKQVRRRAIAEADDIIKDADIEALTGENLKTAIYKERRLELIGEGIRGIDIVRRGESFPAKGSGAQRVGAVSPSSANYMWPIPSSEKAINKLID